MHLTVDQVVALCIIVGVLITTIITAAIIIYRKLQSARIERVSNESNRLRDIVRINARYSFDYGCLPIQRHASLRSKKQFDAFDSVKYLKTELVENIDFIMLWQKRVRTNRCWWDAYINELNAMPPSQFEKVKDRMVEDELVAKVTLPSPTKELSAHVSWGYTSPKGRNSYFNECVFGEREMRALIHKAKDIVTERNTRQAQIARERARMTDKLRYEVMRRDNFRCVLCGSTADDGVKLHVDHIYPVSKGGKTEMSNLRTLCDRCNFGKSDKDEFFD